MPKRTANVGIRTARTTVEMASPPPRSLRATGIYSLGYFARLLVHQATILRSKGIFVDFLDSNQQKYRFQHEIDIFSPYQITFSQENTQKLLLTTGGGLNI